MSKYLEDTKEKMKSFQNGTWICIKTQMGFGFDASYTDLNCVSFTLNKKYAIGKNPLSLATYLDYMWTEGGIGTLYVWQTSTGLDKRFVTINLLIYDKGENPQDLAVIFRGLGKWI